MIMDLGLESVSTITVVSNESINPVPPTYYNFVQGPDGIRTYCVGPAWCGALWKIVRPLLPNTGGLQLSFSLNVDSSVWENAQALEFDARPTDAVGYTYPMDAQFNLAKGGMLQLSIAGKWTDTGLTYPPPAPGTPTVAQFRYSFDTVAKTCSIVSVQLGTQYFGIPPLFQKQPAVKLGWDINELVIQKQIDLNQNGGVAGDLMKNITAQWT